MDTGQPLYLQLYAFIAAVGAHYVFLFLSVVCVIEPVLSLFRRTRAPKRRTVLLILSGIALLVACFQAFNDEHMARLAADKSRSTMEGERDEARHANAVLQKSLDEANARIKALEAELQADGSWEHPVSNRARCPPDSDAFLEKNNVHDIGPGGTGVGMLGFKHPCFISNEASRIDKGGTGYRIEKGK